MVCGNGCLRLCATLVINVACGFWWFVNCFAGLLLLG